jgi:hypothetical protein
VASNRNSWEEIHNLELKILPKAGRSACKVLPGGGGALDLYIGCAFATTKASKRGLFFNMKLVTQVTRLGYEIRPKICNFLEFLGKNHIRTGTF